MNPQLAERAVSVSFRNDWQILAKFNAERRSREATSDVCITWLGDRDSNPDSQVQNLKSYR